VLLSVLLKKEQSLNHTNIQRIKRHLNLWSNIEVRKLNQNVAQRSECSHRDQNVASIQAQNIKNIDQGHARHMWHK